jgi:hypothetical protein
MQRTIWYAWRWFDTHKVVPPKRVWASYEFNVENRRKICESYDIVNPFTFNRDPTEEESTRMVRQMGMNLYFVKTQTPKICKAAVQDDAHALGLVEDQTDEICDTAIDTHPIAILYVRNQTPQQCLEVVRKSPHLIECIDDQTEDLCLLAVSSDPGSLMRIRKENQTYDVCMKALELSSSSDSSVGLLGYVQIPQSYYMQKYAVQRNGHNLYYCSSKTYELCELALRETDLVWDYVPEKFQTPRMASIWFESKQKRLQKIKKLQEKTQ